MSAFGFSTLLRDHGVDPARTCLLRHADTRSGRRRTVYALWRDNPEGFDAYQSVQSIRNRSRLDGADWWATFVVAPVGRTLFAGLYTASRGEIVAQPYISPLDGVGQPGEIDDRYLVARSELLASYIGRICIDWGAGALSWIQRAHKHDKPIVELSASLEEPPFPGFAQFSEPLSRIDTLPTSWRTALSSIGGVYVLTCPRTGELYVGAAYGEGGFLERWSLHAATGGDAVRLQARARSDYQVGILELRSKSTPAKLVIAAEGVWKDKLGSRAHGLSAN